jgi:hypothetical protein
MGTGNYQLTGRYRGVAPPETVGLDCEVVRITSTENRLFYLLSEAPWNCNFHWVGVSVQHQQEGECKYCTRVAPLKFRSYIHALEQCGTLQKSVMVELTHAALVLIDVQLCGQAHRGSIVNLRKSKGGAHGRFVIEMKERRIDPKTLPDEKDPQPVLEKLWALNEKRLAVR